MLISALFKLEPKLLDHGGAGLRLGSGLLVLNIQVDKAPHLA